MLPSGQIDVVAYVTLAGKSPFTTWRSSFDETMRTRITKATLRLADGNFSSVKGIGSGLFEIRLDFGPGYRIYFGKDGDTVVILLGGGTKKRQQDDIQAAQVLWLEYKFRRKNRATRHTLE